MNDTINPLAIDHLSVLGMPPVAFVELVADLGCRQISTGVTPVVQDVLGFPPWSLLEDPGLRREFSAALRDRGVSVAMGEGFWVMPGADIRDRAGTLQLWRELGVRRIGTLSFDPDPDRTQDQFGELADMAAEAGMDVVVEFVPGLAIASLADAVDMVHRVGRRNFRVLVDTLHLVRGGAGADDLAALAPDMIGYAQLCDAPLVSPYAEYAVEATFERLPPGAGELPLAAIVDALPRDVCIGLEVPMRSHIEAGLGIRDALQASIDGARELLLRRSPAP